MTTKGVQTIPWNIKISAQDQLTSTSKFQWHVGTKILYNNVKSWGTVSSSNFTTNGITWHRQGVGSTLEGDGDSLWTSTGIISSMQNGKDYNQVYFFGSYVDNSGFTNDSYTYPTSANSSFAQDIIGFAAETDIAGSFSDEGGDAQARLEKICFFYMHPDTRVRHTYQVSSKLHGSISLGTKFIKPMGRNKQWFCYRLSSSNIDTVHSNKLLFMGIGMQFVHGSKASSHTSANRISNFRVIHGQNTSLNDYDAAHFLYVVPRPHQWSQRSDPQVYTVP